MAMVAAPALKFTARRRPALLVAPAAPTPRELKLLSDIDDQEGLRFHPPIIHFYRRDTSAMDGGGGRDPAPVIRNAVAMALVHYYPLAGRLRELEGRKLAVDCTGEGVLFIEADADVRLEDFGDAVHPPLPCLEELAFDVSGSSAEISSSPLVIIQVTRLACGGFVVAVRTHHTMADAQGVLQFLEAVAELARGAAAPTVHPVWERKLLTARNPPRPSFPHREYDKVPADHHDGAAVSPDAIARCSFFFGPGEIAAIRAHLPPHLRERATTFEVLTGFLWKCRTMALAPDAAAEVRVGCVVSARGGGGGKNDGLRIPKGYYGNSFATPVAIATAGELCASAVGYAVELVRAAKAAVGAEYLRSVADHMALNGRPIFSAVGAFMVSDLTRIRFGDLDYGWGRPVYGGAASLGPMPIPGLSSFLLPGKNADGDDGVVVPMWLPASAMDRFAEEVGKLLPRPSAADDVPAPPQRRGHGVLFTAKRSAL